jgi:hypothetical protein
MTMVVRSTATPFGRKFWAISRHFSGGYRGVLTKTERRYRRANRARPPGGGSGFPDVNVEGCIVQFFYGLSFPAPEGGVVTVAYPIQLQPE